MIKRYKQTLARIGCGLSTMGLLIWILWPNNNGFELDPEPVFLFATALVVWILTEFKTSEEAPLHDPTKNDVKNARIIAGYYKDQLKFILRDHDHGAGIEPRYLSEAGGFKRAICEKEFFFNDQRIQTKLNIFVEELQEFTSYLSLHSTPEMFGTTILQSVIPARVKQSGYIPDMYSEQIDNVNKLATEAWTPFDELYEEIRKRLPRTFDTEIETSWHYWLGGKYT